jgi:ABC-2 type transport system ATP-binding protein
MYLDTGTITVRNKKIGIDVDIPPYVGSIIEAPGFLPNYSGLQNLKFLAGINRSIQLNDIKDALRGVGLNPDMKKHVGKYSLGMRQRLGIAQAIMEKPDILILDEPMNGLDNDGVSEIRKLLLRLKSSGVTILLASHSKEDIQTLCDTVLEMDNGRIIASQSSNKMNRLTPV